LRFALRHFIRTRFIRVLEVIRRTRFFGFGTATGIQVTRDAAELAFRLP
jgi:hypothetical protein